MLTDLLKTIHGLRAGITTETSPPRPAPTGIASIDDALDGGLTPCLHELFGIAPSQTQEAWSPPIGFATHFAQCGQQASAAQSRVVWIGQRCFPFPAFLLATPSFSLLDQSYFVDARTPSDRLWAIEQAISSAVVGVAVADGSRFNMAATRRLQLQAKKHRAFVFLLRPFAEAGELSAAQTRWLVRCRPPAPFDQPAYIRPRWELELSRCKGVRSGDEKACWYLELDHVTRTFCLSAEMARSANLAAMDENQRTLRRTA